MLVDFENDSVRTALEVARALGPRLWGVRLDTSESSSTARSGARWATSSRRGVNERLVRKVREALDADGFERVKIVASGGFTVEKIERLRGASGVPVDSYGVGSSLIRGENDFTADVVMTDGRPSAKVGRALPAESAARARQLTVSAIRAPIPGHSSSGSVERTTCMPAAAKRANAASASSV